MGNKEWAYMNNEEKPIYFSKVLFEEAGGIYRLPKRVTLLNLVEKELSLQVIGIKHQMPIITGTAIKFLPENSLEEVLFSWGIKLSDEQMEALLPYCNALEFESYRGRKMSMEDEGYIGYRDEIEVHFTGVTDSHIPLLKLPMNYYYNEQHIWPSERLYRYIIKTFYEGNKKLRHWAPQYGVGSLF